MMRALVLRLCFLCTLVAIVPGALSAQDPPPPPPPLTDTTALVFEREIFVYPEYARRNPFRPLLTAEGGGPRFERLILLGIILADDPAQSIALFAEGSRTTVSPTEITVEVTGGSYRLRVGERLGTMTVVEIQLRQVVVDVEEFGLSERRVVPLPVRTAGQGGP